MKRAQITKIALLESNGVSYALIYTTANANPIVRGLKQFVTDLDESGRLGGVDARFITSIKHPVLAKQKVALRGGNIEGDFKFTKAGEEYTINEYSSVLTDTNHPDYGKFKLGDKRKREKDGCIVEGFLFMEPSVVRQTLEINADAMAAAQAAALGLFSSPAAPSSNDSAAIDENDIPEEVMQAVMAEQAAVTTETEE
ncbi:MAG: hypothetical protein CMC35_03170 [Flavobacteriaceae bacterium]|nr:hypothetical protein [Flavobacteriaceae bacterium]|tara:strand:- start:1105 stop:1698 length:594 start_codon:yes stop_codon:yes gene_type:complete